jgi:hypothetical protein
VDHFSPIHAVIPCICTTHCITIVAVVISSILSSKYPLLAWRLSHACYVVHECHSLVPSASKLITWHIRGNLYSSLSFILISLHSLLLLKTLHWDFSCLYPQQLKYLGMTSKFYGIKRTWNKNFRLGGEISFFFWERRNRSCEPEVTAVCLRLMYQLSRWSLSKNREVLNPSIWLRQSTTGTYM